METSTVGSKTAATANRKIAPGPYLLQLFEFNLKKNIASLETLTHMSIARCYLWVYIICNTIYDIKL